MKPLFTINLMHKALLLLCLFGPSLWARNGDPNVESFVTKQLNKGVSGFIENKGQFQDQNGKPVSMARYMLNMPGLKVQLRNTGFSYDTWVYEKDEPSADRRFHRVDIELEGANMEAVMLTEHPSGEIVNVINEEGTFKDIHSYNKITYKDIYPGIDLEFVAKKGLNKPVEYNFIVHPGANASMIRMHYKGADDVAIRNEMIEMKLNHGTLKENIPASWMEQTGKSIQVRYKSLDKNLYAFDVPVYDTKQTLIIDPTPNLEWATYYGGSADDWINDVDVDAAGNIYVAGTTSSAAGIASSGAYSGSIGGSFDAFIAKFNSAGQRLWATYYGGTGSDAGSAITFHNGELYVAGVAASDGMATAGAHQTALVDASHPAGFLARFDANTGMRNWSTYYGGYKKVVFTQIVVDAQGNFYAHGGAAPTTFPYNTTDIGDAATAGTFRPTITGDGGTSASVLAKFNASNVRQWGTVTFNTQTTSSGGALALGPDGNVYVAGPAYATGNYFNVAANVVEGQTPGGGNYDGAILKINKDNGTRIWGRYFGGSGSSDIIFNIACDGSYLYVVGQTNSTSGIATPGAFQPSLSANIDGFLAKFNLNGERVFGTYMGSASGTIAAAIGIHLDAQNNLNILGRTNTTSGELATNCTYQPMPAGGNEMFISKFNTSGQRIWGTYFGGSGNENILGTTVFGTACSNPIKTDNQGNIIVGFLATSAGTLATPGAHQTAYAGGSNDGVLAKFNDGTVVPNVTVSPSSISPASQTACILGIPNLITGNVVGITGPAGYSTTIFYQWQVADAVAGPWTNMPGEVFKDLQPLASTTTKYYRRLITINADYCNKIAVDSSSVSTVLINANAAPIANADGPQWYVCGSPDNTVTLNGSATGGTGPYTYEWMAGSSTTPVSTAATYSPAVTLPTTYTMRITDAAGCTDIDQATIVPVLANAGPDKSICQGAGGVQIGTTPIANPDIAYSWIVVSGSPASLSCTACAQPIANPAVATTYQLTVTVTRKDNTTCSSTDQVVVTPVSAPNGQLNFAGTDKTICRGGNVVLGGASAGSGFNYTWSTGQYLSDANIFNPTFNAGTTTIGCAVNYTVTAESSGCTFTDEVKVSMINPDIVNGGTAVCGPLWTNGELSNCAGATYSWTVVSGTGSVLQTANGGADAYLSSPTGSTVFRRTTTLNGVSCTADITVSNACGAVCSFIIDTISDFGCPKVFGANAFKLTALVGNPSNYTFSWSPANMVDNPTNDTVTVTSTVHTTITCTITSNYDPNFTCSNSVEVNNPSWSLPSFTITDQDVCYNTAEPIGIPAVAGYTYKWSPATGLNDENISNPSATLTASQVYTLTVTGAGGCLTSDTINANVIPVVAAAGNDRAVCNGATVTLGSPAPVGTNYNYSWTPINAAWTNGTGPTDPQPQVTFASSSQTFTLTVTDSVSGCTSTDDVTLSGTVLAGEYAGTGDTACPGETVQLGRSAEPFAVYEWTLSDDSPAPGLSCTTCSNPTLTAPGTTTTYKVKVGYPGCTLPMEDLVTITVNVAPDIALIDNNYCPTSPLAIGFGSAGNPAAPANVASYAWSPATGLSCTNCANPTTSVQVPTNYTLQVTYNNGCVQMDSIMITPNTVADAGPDVAICSGQSTIIGSPAVAGMSYSWSGGSFSGPSNVAQPTVNPTATTTYTVSVTNGGCTINDDVLVSVNAPVDFDISGNTAICEGGITTLGISSTPGINTSWQWSPLTGVASPNSPTTIITPDSTQIYRLTQTNMATGCSNYKEIQVVVSPNNISTTSSDTSVCAGSSTPLSLIVTPAGTYQYVWSPSIGLSNAYIANPTVTTNSDRTYFVTVTDNTTQCQAFDTVEVTVKPELECLPPVTLTGNVFHDANGLIDVTVNSTSVFAIPTGMYVSLVNGSNIINTVPVNSNGTFNFGIVEPGSYQIVLHQTPAGLATPDLPVNWMHTGEQLNTGVGNDGSINGILTGITISTSNVTNANFGIQQPPVSDAKAYTIDAPSTNDTIPLDGTHVSTGIGTSSPDQLTGTDPEDGLLNGTGNNKTLVINAAPNYGELWYNGALVMAGDKIANYNPALLSLIVTDTTNNTVSFQYAYIDQAGIESTPVLYTINWSTPLPITLVNFNATKAGDKALLQWETVKEENSDHFIVERSADSRSWQAIAQIPAAGNSNGSRKYEQYDNAPMEGANFYRLVMISLDGGHEYSMIRRLEFGMQIGQIKVVPNPAHKSAVILLDKVSKVEREVRLLNMLGQTVHSFIIPAGTRQYPFDLGSLAQGIYTISIEVSGNTENIKLIVE